MISFWRRSGSDRIDGAWWVMTTDRRGSPASEKLAIRRTVSWCIARVSTGLSFRYEGPCNVDNGCLREIVAYPPNPVQLDVNVTCEHHQIGLDLREINWPELKVKIT